MTGFFIVSARLRFFLNNPVGAAGAAGVAGAAGAGCSTFTLSSEIAAAVTAAVVSALEGALIVEEEEEEGAVPLNDPNRIPALRLAPNCKRVPLLPKVEVAVEVVELADDDDDDDDEDEDELEEVTGVAEDVVRGMSLLLLC